MGAPSPYLGLDPSAPAPGAATGLGQPQPLPVLDQINADRKASGQPALTPDQVTALIGSNDPQHLQKLGVIGTSLQGPLSLTAQMGAHADWDKFQSEARPSTNIEDDRNRPKSIKERVGNAVDDAADDVTGVLFK